MKAATHTASELAAGLQTSMDAQGRARHELSVELAAAPLWRPPGKVARDPDCWFETLKPGRAAAFSTSGESLVAKDDRRIG